MIIGKKQSPLFCLAVLSMFGILPSFASASSPLAAAFGDGLSLFSSATVITFEGIRTGDVSSTDTSNDLSDAGIEVINPDAEQITFNPFTSNTLLDIGDGIVTIEFTDSFMAVGFDYAKASDQTLIFTAYDVDGNVIGSTTSSSNNFGFFGIDGDGTLIKRIVINDHANMFQLDNLTFGVAAHVPLPGAVLLGVLGFGTIGIFRRRFM